MALEAKHTEKLMLFTVLKAQKENPKLAAIKEIKDIILMLKAIMEPEDVELVLQQVADLDA